jgi:hypothetical protein
MTTLIDTVRIEAPTRPPVRPTAPLDAPWDTATEPRSLERSFEVESRGGFARTVVGRLAYFDDEAQTYMVLTRDRVLVRVPLRDITARPPDGVRAGAPRVRVNGVAPGFMRTDIRGPESLGLGEQTPSSVPDLEQLASAAVPLAFLPRPEDYTGHYVQLASRANAAATTRIVVACDGGLDVRGLGPPPSRDSE